jgi:hypothetical protein
MKVTPPISQPVAGGQSAARPAASGFSQMLETSGAAARPAVSGPAPASALAGISSLLTLQGLADPEARSRALRKGRRMLDALDRLQVSMLGEGPTRSDLARLEGAMQETRLPSGDGELDETLNWAEIRVAVEAEKLKRSAGLV